MSRALSTKKKILISIRSLLTPTSHATQGAEIKALCSNRDRKEKKKPDSYLKNLLEGARPRWVFLLVVA